MIDIAKVREATKDLEILVECSGLTSAKISTLSGSRDDKMKLTNQFDVINESLTELERLQKRIEVLDYEEVSNEDYATKIVKEYIKKENKR